MDSSIVATALYTIGNDLEDLTAINWVPLSYTLSCLGFAVAFARISDVIGRRSAFFVAHVFFVLFSYASGSAKTLPQLIAFRALQGIGGSGPFLTSRTCCSHFLTCLRLILHDHDCSAGNMSSKIFQVYRFTDRHGHCLRWRPRPSIGCRDH